MDTTEIKNLSEKNFTIDDIEEIKKNYEISFGKYDSTELKKAIDEKNPFYIKNNFVIGYNNKNNFITSDNKEIKIERLVKAVIVEDVKEEEEEIVEKSGDFFTIIGKNHWESDIDEFMSILGDLRVGEIYLPPHSAVFNFLNPTNKESMDKVASCLEGVNINLYSKENYIDNSIHEIGHLFFRDCVKFDEKVKFKEHFKYLKPNALYEYEWEKSDEEEVFCTLYKWMVKSILLNPSFYNILAHEDPEGLRLIEDVFGRIAKDRIINDVWELNKQNVFDYLNPKFDITMGKKIVKKGLFNDIKDIELPEEVLNDVNKFEDGIMFVNLHKAVVPVEGNKIDWERIK